ncbi:MULTISPECIES: pyridoxal phosphate-dependent decarboxylase family protein [unclassified Arthrobacter]|uniref:pyridoxal phosphate-dependent decarboxylase family protein n=1 Tax=unclassified Arthrobacter TaxID=235627 RepID=UPI002DF7B569|nr:MULTISPECIES: pyridoxal-dependent decarboxylase [unclassified Arthrobacter]MEC5190529.1 glutamate/tyrosine decarboxylase-like PLP-dependent enzyme [Arthrobacter sp. MP_M4]MEC5201880.1 glutamate/tyrosine decarboxylase-like PLP-dependent enzyme [Arthrobacter sp. MP_M7]
MSVPERRYSAALEAAARHARQWLQSQQTRQVGPRVTAADLAADFGGPLPRTGMPAAEVVEYLAAKAEPGLMAMPSGRFFGWVIGGTLPAALAADWLVSAWDQNAGLRFATPATAAIEEAAGKWLLDLLDLPRESDVGFATGATMANFTALAAARWRLLANAGWDLDAEGLSGAPRIHCFVGQERHDTIDLGLRYLGLGRPTVVPADEQGRIDPAELDGALDRALGSSAGGSAGNPPAHAAGGAAGAARPPLLVCLQAGNLHSGAFDPFLEAVAVAKAHGAWVHVDGAFGLWAAAVPELAALTAGLEGADSWGTDAHKTLNVPYDCGITVVRDAHALRAAMGVHTSYLIQDADGAADPFETVPELSRRARGVPVWAALKSLGRDGLAAQVQGLVRHAGQLAERLSALDGVEVLNDVVYTQVSLAFGDDATTRAVTARVMADGRVWMSGSRWQGRDILRISVSNWSTDDADVAVAVDAVRDALAAVRGQDG